MKKLLVLLSAVLVSGCFVCRKAEPKAPEITIQQSPVQEKNVIVRHTVSKVASFEFDSIDVQTDTDKMELLEKDILAHPEAVILVEGHTDSQGTKEYNKDLSLKRAHAMAAILEQRGYPNKIRIYGAGDEFPIATNDTLEGHAKNRRVDVVLMHNDEEDED